MAWYNPFSWSGDDWKRAGLDAATGGQYETYNAITGKGPSIYKDAVNVAKGNPDEIKAAYDQAMAASQANAGQVRDFLMGGKAQAQGYYAPLQHMFQGAYGTEGIQAPQTPAFPQSPFSSVAGGRR